jgi:hypothetical protein
MPQFTQFILYDCLGRNYFEGRIFDREMALRVAKTISNRSYGVCHLFDGRNCINSDGK